MKKLPLLLLIIVTLSGFSVAHSHFDYSNDGGLRKLNNNAFQVGEHLKYNIHYGIINAGEAELKVVGTTIKKGRPVYHMVGTGRSIGMAEWFFKTRDRYETFMDMEAMVPWEFIRDVNEGGYIIKRHLLFDHYNDKASDLELGGKTFDITNNAQDLFSTFYYARCINTDTLIVGESVPINMFLDHEMFPFQFKYLGEEVLNTKFGKILCKKFKPLVQSGRVFKEKEGMTLWVSADKNKIPIRLESQLSVGSIDVDLIDYKNTKHPLVFSK